MDMTKRKKCRVMAFSLEKKPFAFVVFPKKKHVKNMPKKYPIIRRINLHLMQCTCLYYMSLRKCFPVITWLRLVNSIMNYRIYSSRRASYKPRQVFLEWNFWEKILYSNNLINSVNILVKVQPSKIAK